MNCSLLLILEEKWWNVSGAGTTVLHLTPSSTLIFSIAVTLVIRAY